MTDAGEAPQSPAMAKYLAYFEQVANAIAPPLNEAGKRIRELGYPEHECLVESHQPESHPMIWRYVFKVRGVPVHETTLATDGDKLRVDARWLCELNPATPSGTDSTSPPGASQRNT